MPYAPTVDTGRGSFYTPSVTDFGARGDGVADDTNAIKAAYNSIPSTGGCLYFPPGTYLMSSKLVIAQDNVTLQGAGWSSIIKPFDNTFQNDYLIQVQQPPQPGGGVQVFRYGIKIADLYFNGMNNALFGAIELDSTYHAVIDHCQITYFPAISIYLNGPDGGYGNVFGAYTSVRKCYIGNGGAGSAVRTNCHEFNRIEDCLIAWYNSANGVGVYLTGSDNQVINTSFDECDTSVYVYFCKDNLIHGCNFDRGLTHHIWLNGASNTRVANNCFQDFSGTGSKAIIDLLSTACINNTIANNLFEPGNGWTSAIIEGNTATSANTFEHNDFSTYAVTKTNGIFRNNQGYNPQGFITAPTIPASGTAVTGSNNFDCTVYVKGGTVTVIAVGGTTTGMTSGPIKVPAGKTITLTYSSAPTWTWYAE